MAARIPLALFLILALAAPAMAAPTLPESLYYRLSWNGISLGRIRVTATETPTTYSMLIDTKSKGVASMFSPFRTLAQVQGIKQQGRYIPTRYETTSEKSDEGDNHTNLITYDENGRILTQASNPPNNDPSWRPIVPVDKASEATDPITAFIAMRAELVRASVQGVGEISRKSYDNKRLAVLKATLLSKSKTSIRTRISRHPIAGYTEKELKKYKQGDPEFIVTFFTADSHIMPSKLELKLLLGTLIATQQNE